MGAAEVVRNLSTIIRTRILPFPLTLFLGNVESISGYRSQIWSPVRLREASEAYKLLDALEKRLLAC